MATRSFIDTNVLVYAEASDEPLKQRATKRLRYNACKRKFMMPYEKVT